MVDPTKRRKRLEAFEGICACGELEASMRPRADGKSELTSESRLVRRHTVASIFIDLYEELLTTGRLMDNPEIANVSVGNLVSMRMGPAVAPLRRVLDQVIRLLNVMAPMLSDEADDRDGVDVRGMERAAYEAAGATFKADEISDPESEVEAPGIETPEMQVEDGVSEDADDASPEDNDEIMFGDDIAALTPVVHGPAVQILPLAICS